MRFSPSTVTPASGSGTNSTLTINTSNAAMAHAIAPVIADAADTRLRRGQVARPSPWTNVN